MEIEKNILLDFQAQLLEKGARAYEEDQCFFAFTRSVLFEKKPFGWAEV